MEVQGTEPWRLVADKHRITVRDFDRKAAITFLIAMLCVCFVYAVRLSGLLGARKAKPIPWPKD